MASEERENLWDFAPAIELLHTLSQSVTHQLAELSPTPPIASSSSSSSCSSRSGSVTEGSKRRATLGDFDRVFRALNQRVTNSLPDAQPVTIDDGSYVSNNETTPPTTPQDGDTQHVDNILNTKEVRWMDQIDEVVAINHHQHKSSAQIPSKTRKLGSNNFSSQTSLDEMKAGTSKGKKQRRAKQLQHENVSAKLIVEKPSGVAIDAKDDEDSWWLTKSSFEISRDAGTISARTAPAAPLLSAQHLRPAWVTPLRTQAQLWQPIILNDAGVILPMLILTRQQKKARLVRRLGETLGFSSLEHFNLPKSLYQYGGNIAVDGIHVFVDSSNIAIGFNEALKLARGLPVRQYTKRARLSFHSLALILERGRNVSKRVLVGSSNRDGELPDYMHEAERCGYEINCLRRVEKLKEARSTAQRSRTGNGYGNSGQSSGSETQMPHTRKVTEQGVDEILHMKILESLVDSNRPSTIILATGDAAEAEYSGGFLKNVIRALSKGWKVELVAWGHSMSYAYRSNEFLQEWENRFTIIDLDNFSEELYGSYID